MAGVCLGDGDALGLARRKEVAPADPPCRGVLTPLPRVRSLASLRQRGSQERLCCGIAVLNPSGLLASQPRASKFGTRIGYRRKRSDFEAFLDRRTLTSAITAQLLRGASGAPES